LGPTHLRKGLAAAGAAVLVAVLALAPRAKAAGAGALEAKLSAARGEAGALASGLRESHEQLAVAEGEAAAAEAHEQRLSDLLAEGEQRAAELSRRATRTRDQLAVEKARLRRSRTALAQRLVAIYESGSPSTASLILGSTSYEDLITRTDYLREIEESDNALADRVEQVRDAVRRQVVLVAKLQARAVAYDERLAAARSQISAVRQEAEESAAHLQSISAGREASLASLKSSIGSWVKEIQTARAAEAQAVSRSEAEAEVGRWLGGPYSIPTFIVMCESGGNYSAVNPSSGAGGAYQVLPSTWALYGGHGEPQNAPKAEQDRIAGEIWADSGPSAWVCG
jgi:septal ring factor EnvC (AmiA/AmiB activator)